VTANQIYYFDLLFLLACLNIVEQFFLKNIVMKKLFEKIYDYLSNLLFGNQSPTHY
jgi:hypothetical protein